MEQDVRVAGGTADTETGQLLIQIAVCVLLYCEITNVSISPFSTNLLSFKH